MWRFLKNPDRKSTAFAAALFIHGLLFVSIFPVTKWNSPFNELKERAIEIISPKDLDALRKPVVKTSKAKESASSTETAQFGGEFEQRVEQETQSPIKGNFREGEVFKPKESPELAEGEELKEPGEMTSKNFLSFGQSPYALPKDIPLGNQTVLNTDKVRYASFINRIADEIYQPWVEAAEHALREFTVGQKKMEPNIYITRLRVTLNSDGNVTGIQVMDSCGILELDEAPKKAFWTSEPFPNPPNQLMEKDGYVRLTYEFQFEWKNSGFNIIPWKI